MLVLSREANEAVVIHGVVKLVVVGIRGKTVRLGFEAPREITIDREEVHAAKELQRLTTAAADESTN